MSADASELPAELRELYPFSSHWLDLPAGRMHYLDEGQGRPVIMLHGNPTWSFFYRDLVKQLSPKRRCIVPDHIGCGLSDKPQDFSYRLADHIAHVKALVEHLKLEAFDLVVHDWGGAIGMGLAAAMPDRVGRLVVMNTAAFRSRRIPLRIAACRIPLLGELMVRGFNAFAGTAVYMAVKGSLNSRPAVKQGFLYPYHNWASRIATHRFVKDIPLDESHPSYATLVKVEEGLAQFRDKPMLLCWGMLDFCFTPHFLEEWQARFPEAQVERYDEAGHYLMEDAGEAVRERISRFLQEQ